jgi:nucleoside-diphosphate-sugar epimerase
MKIFVTGGTGFLGKHVIERLLNENHKIVALARRENAFYYKGIMEVFGDLDNLDEWKHELGNCDIVIHCAAPVEFWGPWRKYYKEIIYATYRLLQAADEYNIKRFIYISSEAVLQSKMDLMNISEDHPYPLEPNSLYGKAKKLAEQSILSYQGKIETIIIRPTFIYGKNVKAIETMRDAVFKGKFRWINNGETIIEMVYVKNVAVAIVKAIDHGKDNGIYYVTDHCSLTAKKFLTDLLATIDIEIPDKSIPLFVAKPVAWLVEYLWKIFRIASYPPLTRFDLSFLSMNRQYKIDKSLNELHYKPIYTTEEALGEMKRC